MRSSWDRYQWGALLTALLGSAFASAQIKSIQDNGAAEGLPPSAVNFEPEYRDRSARQAGVSVPAPKGTKPSSSDPHDLSGIWIVSKTFPISGASEAPAGFPGGDPRKRVENPAAGPHYEGVYGVGKRTERRAICVPSATFAIGLPGKIIQTDQVIYILRNGQDGVSYRRIVMNGTHPANLKPSYVGDSIGHWDGDALVVETVALKGRMQAGMFGGDVGADFTPQTRVTERFRKVEGNMQLEDEITFEDPTVLKQPYKARIRNYWRPDLKFVEAPCEEYSDPLETEDSGPFAGGDEPQRGLPDQPKAPK